jgi:hypothetical protein
MMKLLFDLNSTPAIFQPFSLPRAIWCFVILALLGGIAEKIPAQSAITVDESNPVTASSETQTPKSAPNSANDRQQVNELVTRLASENFTTRQLAKAKLLELGSDIISTLDDNLATADVDVSTQIFEIYSQFALDPQSEATRKVVQSLKKLIASETSRNSILAMQLLESIRELHSERAGKELQALGAGIIQGIYPLNGRTGIEQQLFVEVNEGFRGNANDLVWLQWLTKVELVILKGPNINGECLKYLGEMPSLKKLLIRDTSIVSADLHWLEEIDDLDHLEILYSPIDDKSVDTLIGLSVWKSMRIFGTNISFEAGEKLIQNLDAIEVQFGCGGFLGIQSDVQAARTSTVSETTPNGAAERAGIIAGDIITRIDDEAVTTFEDIRANLRKRRPGEKVVVELERVNFNGEMNVLQINVVLGRQE